MDDYTRRIHFICTISGFSERARAHMLGIEDDPELVELYVVARDRRQLEVMYSTVAEIKRRVERSTLTYRPFLPILSAQHP